MRRKPAKPNLDIFKADPELAELSRELDELLETVGVDTNDAEAIERAVQTYPEIAELCERIVQREPTPEKGKITSGPTYWLEKLNELVRHQRPDDTGGPVMLVEAAAFIGTPAQCREAETIDTEVRQKAIAQGVDPFDPAQQQNLHHIANRDRDLLARLAKLEAELANRTRKRLTLRQQDPQDPRSPRI